MRSVLPVVLSTLLLFSLAAAALSAADSADDEKKRSIDITFYGYLKLDAAWDDSRLDAGNFARWVLSESANDGDSEFNMTARETRLGARFSGPKTADISVRGQVEIDFYGGGTENKNTPMMRHAFVEVEWPEWDLSLIAGQTWDVISPLNPRTVNYSVAWWSGNIGYRRPQVRLTKVFKTGGGTFKIAGAVARNIGHDSFFDPGDTGEDFAVPVLQGRVGYGFDMPGGAGGIGISGHWGREEFDRTAAGDNPAEVDSWSVNLDVSLPIASGLTFAGELFTGENLDAYLGGVGQGVDLASLTEVGSTGGWAALSFSPSADVNMNVGAAVDDPKDEDLWSGARTLNRSIWVNAYYALAPSVKVATEIAHWLTEYGDEEGDALRAHFAVIYSF